MSALSFDVMPLIAGALLEERDHWRENAAAELQTLTMCIEGRIKPRPHKSKAALKADAKSLARQLGDALAGEVFCSHCGVCGQPMRNGQGALQDVEMGDIHADCGAPFSIKAGERVDVGADAIAWDEEDEAENPGGKPDHLTAHEVSPLYTEEQMREVVDKTHAAIAKATGEAA